MYVIYFNYKVQRTSGVTLDMNSGVVYIDINTNLLTNIFIISKLYHCVGPCESLT